MSDQVGNRQVGDRQVGDRNPQASHSDLNLQASHSDRKAYRAVFLRIHPTGKMVLSLTTEADGHEPHYAGVVAEQLGVPPLDVKVLPADTNRFGEEHGFDTTPSAGTSEAIVSATGKILDKARLLAGMAMQAPPDSLSWGDGVFAIGGESPQSQTIAELAMYSYGSGALPSGVEGGLDAQTVYRD
jgi:aerobic carbon-monoxide dehydrogenase large subunit